MIDVTVVLVNDGYASTAIAPLEVFSSAGVLLNAFAGETPRPQFRVQVASLDGQPVQSAHQLAVSPQTSISEIEKTDLIVVSAIGLDVDGALAAHRPLLDWLCHWNAHGAGVAAACAGVSFLAEAGLLDGRRATTHWALAQEFAQRYPKVDWHPEAFITEDAGVYCGGGVYGVIDLSLYLVEKFCGHDIALDCARSMLVEMPRVNQAGFAVLPLTSRHDDGAIRKAEEWLHAHFHEDVKLEGLAAQLGMSPRNFERRFKAATGMKARNYLQALRVAAARRMLEQGARSVQQVGSAVGYDDAAHFRTLFKRHTGLTPAAYRARFGREAERLPAGRS
ncbi:GlxA family transcriptional regulator [Fodinicurvata sediminis]|uniref:GlxA family transcriptional regulator n=1 Tax=Fodinicurvata sediminis TaxID=1121832 RepID=UPI0003B48997|nr:helix-turn-helix domain-containing protein [Fodinicurvata sediminis]